MAKLLADISDILVSLDKNIYGRHSLYDCTSGNHTTLRFSVIKGIHLRLALF